MAEEEKEKKTDGLDDGKLEDLQKKVDESEKKYSDLLKEAQNVYSMAQQLQQQNAVLARYLDAMTELVLKNKALEDKASSAAQPGK